MPGGPLISIVLPAWNAAATIGACLDSIRRQTEPSWECVVVDDGSSDGTRALAEAAAVSDPRFRVVAREHGGIVAALNAGIRAARGAFIARMDADDLMQRERLAAQRAALVDDATLAAVGCHVRIFPRDGMSVRLREYEAWLNGMASPDEVARDAFVECPVAHPTLMMRREMAALAYEDHGWPEDHDLVLRALARGMRIGVVPRRLLSWRDRRDGLSRTDPAYSLERFTACRAHYLANGFLRGRDAYVLWGYGATGRALARALAAHGKHPSHIVEIKRSRIGQRIHGAPVVAIDALPALRGARVIVSVARGGPRAEIRAALAAMRFVEGEDFVCAA